jgi:hypothetical protein
VGFFIAMMIVLLGVFTLELIDGMVSLFKVDGADEEWLAPMAMISLILFVLALVYLG